MTRADSAHSESDSERVPTKKQKKEEEKPVDDPMDEDEEGGEGPDEEYEIEKIIDSRDDVFNDVCPFVGLGLRANN